MQQSVSHTCAPRARRPASLPAQLLLLLLLVALAMTVAVAYGSALHADAATAGDQATANHNSSSYHHSGERDHDIWRNESFWTREVMRVQEYTAHKYMARMAARPNVSSLPSGVLMTVLQRGNGDVAPGDDDACVLHYTAYYRFNTIWDDTRSFTRYSDGSYVIKGTPVQRRPRDMLPGVREAMKLMREGDRWFIYVPYQLAYGVRGNATMDVPPYASVRYDLELLHCPNAHGRASSDIDAYLAKYLKQPMPPKRAAQA